MAVEMTAKNEIIDLAQERPERKLFENPIAWWGDTPWLLWNFNYGGIGGLWAGSGEAEALGELFFDNLATLLSVTDLMLGFFLQVLIRNEIQFGSLGDFAYADAVCDRYTELYYERAIPGVAVGLFFGNFYYAYMAGRLAYKESRDDVTAQPYGINTTGAFITLGAINLNALFGEIYNEYDPTDPAKAGKKAAENAFSIAVSANFLTGLMEIAGCLLAEPIRALIPSPAYYSLLTGVGFTYLAFGPMIKIAAEPILCVVPLLVVIAGFFGNTKYKIGNTGLTVPIAVVAILLSVLIGWLGGCKHKNDAVEMYNYGLKYPETRAEPYNGFSRHTGNPGYRNSFWNQAKWKTCTGTSKHNAVYAYDTFAGDLSSFSPFADLGFMKWKEMKYYFGLIVVVGVVGFGASLSCVESASAAGDDYPMAETLIVDGVGTCLGACFGSFYGTTVYIGHPIHKTLGARRGYSAINGMIYVVILWSGLFAALYQSIPGCANGALLIFVGLLICRQAIEDNPPDYYPAVFFGLFPCLCNWAKLYVDPGTPWNSGPGWWDSADAGNWGSAGMGIKFMGQGGGEWFTLFMTSIFCYCTDRDFKKGAICCALATFLQLTTGIPTLYNAATSRNIMGPEKAGYYPKKNADTNFSWMWVVAFAMSTGFFLIHFGLQQAGLIDPPIVRDHIKIKGKDAAVVDEKAMVAEEA